MVVELGWVGCSDGTWRADKKNWRRGFARNERKVIRENLDLLRSSWQIAGKVRRGRRFACYGKPYGR